MSLSKFSQFNNPCFNISPDFFDHPKFQDLYGPSQPYPLVRGTHEWRYYFGDYPRFCAMITTEKDIQERIQQGARHVVKDPVKTVDCMSQIHLTQRDLLDKIARIMEQMGKLGIVWRKEASHFHFFLESEEIEMHMDMFVCDDSGFFHVLIYMDKIIEPDGKIIQPAANTHDINELILCIRYIFLDRDPVVTAPLLTRYAWNMAVHLTLAPDFDQVDIYPEWMDDKNPDWNFPETEPFK
jgi:hypothetical protein